jgi:hypothetical protein
MYGDSDKENNMDLFMFYLVLLGNNLWVCAGYIRRGLQKKEISQAADKEEIENVEKITFKSIRKRAESQPRGGESEMMPLINNSINADDSQVQNNTGTDNNLVNEMGEPPKDDEKRLSQLWKEDDRE